MRHHTDLPTVQRSATRGVGARRTAARRGSPPVVCRPSARELQVIAGVAAGRSNDEIAAMLGLSSRTVAGHLRRCFVRYDLACRTELAMLAVREGWTEVIGPSWSPGLPSADVDQ